MGPRTLPEANETSIKRNVTRYLELNGWLVTRAQAFGFKGGMRSVKNGTGDLICCANGTYVEVETKTAKGKLSREQVARSALVAHAGGYYYVIRSVSDAEKMVTELYEITREP